MSKFIGTIVFIISEIVFLCIMGEHNSVPLGNLYFIRTYGDLAVFLVCSAVMAGVCIYITKYWSDGL